MWGLGDRVSIYAIHIMYCLDQGSATYGPQNGSGQPSNYIQPAYSYAHPARDLFFVMIEIHQQSWRTAEIIFWWRPFFLFLLVSAVKSAVKCLMFRRRSFLVRCNGGGPLEWWWPAVTLLNLDVAHGTWKLPTPGLDGQFRELFFSIEKTKVLKRIVASNK